MKIIIDTNTYSNFVRGDENAGFYVNVAQEILISPIVVGELYFGFQKGSFEQKNMSLFESFVTSSRVTMLEVTPDTARFFAGIKKKLFENGTPIPIADVWIAASAMQHGATVVSYDKHFQVIPGLFVINPANRN